MGAEKPKRSESTRGDGPVRLTVGLEKHLAAYAGAAAAAGVSLLALTPAAAAKIVYTPTNIPIPNHHFVLLDLNHDGIEDFGVSNISFSHNVSILSAGCAGHGANEQVSPPYHFVCSYQTNQVWGRGVAAGRFASALPAGFKVRPSKSYFQAANYPYQALMFKAGAGNFYNNTSGTWGQWLYTKNRYLGLQFVINGQVHYGWARLSVTVKQGGIFAVLTGYAYETVPNKPIITGKTKGPDVVTLDPATLGHLAQGASLFPVWRVVRNRSAVAEGSH